MSAAESMLQELRRHRTGYALPRDFYRDETFLQLELDHLFHKDWIFAGHDCEIPKAGDFFTIELGQYPLIVARDKNGKIHAHHNTCRHRGFRVCDELHGSVKRFVCPYHQWSYDPDGSLIRTKAMGQENFQQGEYGLKQAHAESAGGYIFVSVADQPPDFARLREMVTPYFAPFDVANARVAYESRIIEEGNWKLVLENNRECYHCAGSHPELCRTFPGSAFVHAHHHRSGRRHHREVLERGGGGRVAQPIQDRRQGPVASRDAHSAHGSRTLVHDERQASGGEAHGQRAPTASWVR